VESAKTPSRRLGYVPELDGVRGIAIAAVVLYHFFGLPGGFMGVDLFFVLSGFLITTLLLEDGRLGNFYVRRMARLLPPLLPVVIICSPLGWPRLAEAFLYAGNFFAGFEPQHVAVAVSHLWSLAEEEQFYLLWPLALVTFAGRRQRLAVVLAALFIALVAYRISLAEAGAGLARLYYLPDTHADGLLLGCVAALVRPRVGGAVGRIGLVAVLAFFALGAWTANWLAYGLPLFEVAAVLLVLAGAAGHMPELTVRPVVWLGLISYSLYLWHQPVHALAGRHVLIGLPIALILAAASYRFIEQPMRRRAREALQPMPAIA
jgi:peptidoglycan/LPS O-acetylase OafA/YrhL